MALGRRMRRAVQYGVGLFLATQAATVIGLTIIDHYRRHERRHVAFPSRPPTDVSLGDLGDVTVYTKGNDLFDDMIAAIDAAENRVLFETYIWKGDRVGRRFVDALTRAADRGVTVCVVYDVFANLVVQRSFFDLDPRIHVLRHHPMAGLRGTLVRLPGLNHRKMLVTDGETAFVGGYNIGSLYATRWRDTHLRLDGPGAADLENAFVDYWNQAKPRSLPALPQPTTRGWDPSLRVVRNVPTVGVYPIRYMYLEAIDRARDHIYLTHAYLIPDDDLMYALTDACHRGVDVRIIVPAESNHVVADWLSRGFYHSLLKNGVRLFLYQDAMVHAKTATIDGEWSTVGTANLDRLSLTGNYELNLEVVNPDLASTLEQVFEMDLGNCVELTLSTWGHRPLAAKVSETILVPLRPLL